jgi:chromosome segregation ATPase
MSKVVVNGGMNTISGDVEHLDMHGGICYLEGSIGSMNHYAGIVYDQRPSNRVEFRDNVLDADERQRLLRRIDDLNEVVEKLHKERMSLRRKLKQQQESIKEVIPDDDVLVQRICTLRKELEKEREAHKKDVDDLNYRLDVAMEVNADLRHRIEDPDKKSQEIAERHVDILASLMALYPFTPTDDLTFEFGLPPQRINYVATALNVIKSKEERDQAREYLQKQGLQLMERRGGNQRKPERSER